MLTFQKSFQWISKVFYFIFFLVRHLKDKIFKIILLNISIMKKYISYTASSRLQWVFTAFLMLLSGPALLAQRISGPYMLIQQNSQQEQNLVVAYGSPFSYTLGENITWELKDESGSLVVSSKGNVSGHVFNKPGSYTLFIHEDRNHDTNTCDHTHFPEKLTIEVRPVKVAFDFSTIRFSKEITGGQPANGITVSVNVNFSSYDNSTAVYNQGLTSFGVGSTVSGKLKNGESILKPGVNTLEFVLEGQTEAGNNIQLNFVDFNGEVQPYTLTPKI